MDIFGTSNENECEFCGLENSRYSVRVQNTITHLCKHCYLDWMRQKHAGVKIPFAKFKQYHLPLHSDTPEVKAR